MRDVLCRNVLPVGTYTYANSLTPVDPSENRVVFDYWTDEISWTQSGAHFSAALSGDWLKFFQSIYLSDRPVYDWLVSGPRSLEGLAGNVAGNMYITVDECGRLSRLRINSGLVQVTVAVSKGIVADTLVVSGATRGQPDLLHSCITLLGTANCLHLTDQGNVVLDNMILSANRDGVGLKADKTGGDTFIAGKVFVDGRVEWMNRYANLQPVTADAAAVLETNGQDIVIGGMNVGRVGRNLSFSTGENKPGSIIIGETVSVDFARGKMIDDLTRGTLTFSTSGNLIAGSGDVIIGTNATRAVEIDLIGAIQGRNVIIYPTDNGVPTHITATIGAITASENIQIKVGDVNQGRRACLAIGDLNAQNGSITLEAQNINGRVGSITAPNGTVDINLASAKGVGDITGKVVSKQIGVPAPEIKAFLISDVTVNSIPAKCAAYRINGEFYVRMRDLACALSGSAVQFQLEWFDDVYGAEITLKKGFPCGEAAPSVNFADVAEATPTAWSIYLDNVPQYIASYSVDGVNFFSIVQLAERLGFRLFCETDAGHLELSI